MNKLVLLIASRQLSLVMTSVSCRMQLASAWLFSLRGISLTHNHTSPQARLGLTGERLEVPVP